MAWPAAARAGNRGLTLGGGGGYDVPAQQVQASPSCRARPVTLCPGAGAAPSTPRPASALQVGLGICCFWKQTAPCFFGRAPTGTAQHVPHPRGQTQPKPPASQKSHSWWEVMGTGLCWWLPVRAGGPGAAPDARPKVAAPRPNRSRSAVISCDWFLPPAVQELELPVSSVAVGQAPCAGALPSRGAELGVVPCRARAGGAVPPGTQLLSPRRQRLRGSPRPEKGLPPPGLTARWPEPARSPSDAPRPGCAVPPVPGPPPADPRPRRAAPLWKARATRSRRPQGNGERSGGAGLPAPTSLSQGHGRGIRQAASGYRATSRDTQGRLRDLWVPITGPSVQTARRKCC